MVSGEWDKYKTLLTILFILVFISRLYFALQDPHFSNESYYTLRHVEHIQETGIPLYDDPLSYGGRTYYFPPLFHYLLAGLSIIFPLQIIAKVLPNLLFSILIFLVYGISYRITEHKQYSFLAALFFSFTPISYLFPINTVNAYSLAIPLFFGIIYCMLDIENNLNTMLLLIVALVFTHPSAFILVLGLIFYLFLLKIEGLETDERSLEVIIFTIFLVFWALFILYKNVFLEQGIGAVWQNLPDTLLAAAFPPLSLFQIIFFVGMVPLFLGMIGAYGAVFKKPHKDLLMLLGFTLSIFLMLFFNFVRLGTGLLYLSVLLSIMSAQGLKERGEYMKKTKFSGARILTIGSLVFFFIITSVAPLYSNAVDEAAQGPTEEEIEALKWIKSNTPEESVVLSPVQQGHLITYFADRKNVMDTNFLLIEEVNQRFRDLRRAYTVRLKSEPLRVYTKYDVDYVFFTQSAREMSGVDRLYYADDDCFTLPYDEGVKIYHVRCRLGGET